MLLQRNKFVKLHRLQYNSIQTLRCYSSPLNVLLMATRELVFVSKEYSSYIHAEETGGRENKGGRGFREEALSHDLA